tara:strand:+ start:825 stop:1088 length:264 start_codon:yes stop_codon:yes gene_type:complete
MIMDIEEIISIFAKNGNKEMVETLRIIQSRGIDEVTLNDKDFIDSDSEDSEDSDISDLESESSEEDYEVVEENIQVTLNKEGFYELI